MKRSSAVGSCRADAEQSEESWTQGELTGCQFKDERLSKRFSMVLKQLAEGTAESMPLACQDWANTKAAYRFFANERVSEADILTSPVTAPSSAGGSSGTVAAVMTRQPITVDAGATVGQARALVVDQGLRTVPVLEEGRLVGVLSRSDLV